MLLAVAAFVVISGQYGSTLDRCPGSWQAGATAVVPALPNSFNCSNLSCRSCFDPACVAMWFLNTARVRLNCWLKGSRSSSTVRCDSIPARCRYISCELSHRQRPSAERGHVRARKQGSKGARRFTRSRDIDFVKLVRTHTQGDRETYSCALNDNIKQHEVNGTCPKPSVSQSAAVHIILSYLIRRRIFPFMAMIRVHQFLVMNSETQRHSPATIFSRSSLRAPVTSRVFFVPRYTCVRVRACTREVTRAGVRVSH